MGGFSEVEGEEDLVVVQLARELSIGVRVSGAFGCGFLMIARGRGRKTDSTQRRNVTKTDLVVILGL